MSIANSEQKLMQRKDLIKQFSSWKQICIFIKWR